MKTNINDLGLRLMEIGKNRGGGIQKGLLLRYRAEGILWLCSAC